MSERTRLLGAALALCAALVVTMAVAEAEALTCNVDGVRVTTRTFTKAGSSIVDSGSSVRFRFNDGGSTWPVAYTFYLDNPGVEDFKEGAIDEFTKRWGTGKPVYPTDFQRFQIEARANLDTWGLSGLKVEIMCEGVSSDWKPIFVNRGVNTNLTWNSPPYRYESSVGSAGSDSYNGAHEVFWLINIGDTFVLPQPDGVPDDLSNCDETTGPGDVECRMGAVLVDGANATIIDTPLTESWWDVNDDGVNDIVNPLEYTPPEENANLATDNFWRWFWTSGSFTHNAVSKAKLVLSDCTHTVGPPGGEGNCFMQADYLHADVMQAWAASGYTTPRFRAHVYEGDFGPNGRMEIPPGNTGATDSVETNHSRLKTIYYYYPHVESQQDSEHTFNQETNACGYMSADMILSTRGFSPEEIWNTPPFDEADTWQEASAIAHLVWGYKEMCCGSWDCCADPTDCRSTTIVNHVGTLTQCDASNFTGWWLSDRCDWDPASDDWCYGRSDDSGSSARDRYFWRDQNGTNYITEAERWPFLIDYDGVIQWDGEPGVDDDGNGTIDDNTDFWGAIKGAKSEILGKFLVDQVPNPATEWELHGSYDCNNDPVTLDDWFGGMTVVESLDMGYGMFFSWSHSVNVCEDGVHYSTIDGYEYIYHPGTASYDYLFFIGNPNEPRGVPGDEWSYDAMDNTGFTRDDFERTVQGIGIWNYDFYY
jgi:hypothetical protein